MSDFVSEEAQKIECKSNFSCFVRRFGCTFFVSFAAYCMIPLTPGLSVVAVNVAAEDGVVLPIERRLSIVPMAELEKEAHAEDSKFVSVGTQTDFSVSEAF